jgi:hypothetical protein
MLVVMVPRYNDGCQTCHRAFDGPTSPKGTIFPSDSKHEMHRGAQNMKTDCDLCHTTGDDRNPYIASSNGTANNPGVGCTGCHGRDYGGAIGSSGVGLRAHHAAAGFAFCYDCHLIEDEPTPLPEWVSPIYYGTADTNVDDPCNTLAGFLENWSIGDTQGLDNDGDMLYDGDDPDCACADDDLDEVTDCDGDCDDSNETVFPGAPEICDGLDNDCNDVIDEGLGTTACDAPQCPHTIDNCLGGTAQTCHACVDLRAAAVFLTCFGDYPTGVPPSCMAFDYDQDSDVDLADHGQFLLTFVGP